ncbi:MAG: hypothetical protein IJY95_07915 [Bacteroides sp.]|nr:hypothetical protein [Bacteroides sp.]
MKNLFKVQAQSEVFFVSSQKAEGGQLPKCNIVLKELGGKFENSYVATILGDQARIRFEKDELVIAALRFSTREYNGQVYQDIVVNEIVKINK